MIVMDCGCYGAQIHHDHGTAQASGRLMIAKDLAPWAVANPPRSWGLAAYLGRSARQDVLQAGGDEVPAPLAVNPGLTLLAHGRGGGGVGEQRGQAADEGAEVAAWHHVAGLPRLDRVRGAAGVAADHRQ